MQVHKYAAARRRTRGRQHSGPVVVTRADPAAMAAARHLARGDRRVVVVSATVVLVVNGAR